jgi:hypothetical protein
MTTSSQVNVRFLACVSELQFVAGMAVVAERIPVDYVVRTVVHVLFVESVLVAMTAGMVVCTY